LDSTEIFLLCQTFCLLCLCSGHGFGILELIVFVSIYLLAEATSRRFALFDCRTRSYVAKVPVEK
jgi:hypothetical protein